MHSAPVRSTARRPAQSKKTVRPSVVSSPAQVFFFSPEDVPVADQYHFLEHFEHFEIVTTDNIENMSTSSASSEVAPKTLTQDQQLTMTQLQSEVDKI